MRAVLDGPQAYDRDLWAGLGELGYLGATIPEAFGGLGAGYLEACVIAEELGRAVAPIPFSSSIALAAECLMTAGSQGQRQRYLPGLASGASIGTLALVEGAGRSGGDSIRARTRRNGERITVSGSKVAVPDGGIADFAVVAARDPADQGGAVSLLLVDLNGPGVVCTPVDTIDPTRGHARLDFNDARCEPLGEPGTGLAVLETVMDRAAVLVAFEQLGGADRALEMGRDYALERFAFGRPIGSLQAVKHLLADMYVSATLARSNCYYAAWALSTEAPDLPVAAATARVSASQAFQHCARNNIQVHGGMGFTWEFDCHLYYRRSNLLALTLGSLASWEDRLIDRLRAKRAA